LRLLKTTMALLLASVVFGNGTPSCKQVAAPQLNVRTQQPPVETDPNDLAAYYGFGEMEMVKLDRGIKDLRIADLDRDGRNDIAVVNNRKARIELLIQKESVGPDQTTVAVDPEDADINQITFPTRFERQSVPVSQKVFSFVCGDLNADGLWDLSYYGEPKGLYVMLQKAAEDKENKAKTLSWRTKKIEIDDGLVSSDALVCADLSNDGGDDLALAGRDAIYIILQKEDGSLAEPVKYATTAVTLGVRVGDLNGDEINDLILVTNDSEKPIHVRFGLKTGPLGPQERFFIEKPYALQLFNMNDLAGDEILAIDALSGRLTCYEYTPEKEKDADWPILFYPIAAGKENTKRDLVAGDFDGDRLADIAISEPGAAEVILYKQVPGLGPAEPVRFPAFADISTLSAADIDNDGKTELAVLSVKEKIIGLSELANNRLSFPKPLDLIGEPVAMELADIDGSGAIDCIYISKDANDNRFLRVVNNSYVSANRESNLDDLLASWKEAGEDWPALELKKLTSNPEGIKVLDVDQDGLQDVLIFVRYESPILVRQTQKSRFEVVDSPKAQASLIKEASLGSIAVADVDGKPGKELLLAQDNFARSLVFAQGQNWSIIDQYNAKNTDNKISAVGAFDIDNVDCQDQPAILLLDGQKAQLQILKTADDKTYRLEKELNVGTWQSATHSKMLFAPLTGGEVKSVLLFDSEKFALLSPPSRHNLPRRLEQKFSYETQIKEGAYGNLAAGDMNADDRADIVMVEYKRNHIEILALDSQRNPLPAMRFKIFEEKTYRNRTEPSQVSVEPRELEIADVTGDGKSDLVTVIHDRIIIYPQD
jgi:hypothetical protein